MSVISISDKFRLLEQPASPVLNDPKAGLHSSVNVTVGQDAGGMVRGHATIVNDGLSKWLPSEPTGGVREAAALAEKMSSAWIAVARTGSPGNPKTGNWPAYGSARATMMFDNESKVVNDPAGAERHLWTTVIG